MSNYHTVLAIGDLHDSPELDKKRFEWLGKLTCDVKPDYVLSIGDWATLDSLNTHISNDSSEGRKKPTWDEDMKSLKESINSFKKPIEEYQQKLKENHRKRYKPKFVITEGNHEYRSALYGNKNPEVDTKLRNELRGIFEDAEFHYQPFKKYYYIGNTAFVHCPISVMGKPLGGENVANSAANKTVHDLVFGHTHKRATMTKPKLGDANQMVTVIDLGCALPDGFIEDYAKHNTTGWSWGCYVLKICKTNGNIIADKYISMKELGERYAQ